MKCSQCNSLDIVHNGHSSSGKKRFKCKRCGKTFGKKTNYIHSENLKKGYPQTSVSFEFIALMLYHHRHFKDRSGFSRYVNRFLDMINKKPVHRTTIYSWIKKYGKKYNKLISWEEANKWYWKHEIKMPYRTYKKQNRLKKEKTISERIEKLDNFYKDFLLWLGKEIGFNYKQIGDLERKHPEALEKLKEIYKEKLTYEHICEITIELDQKER